MYISVAELKRSIVEKKGLSRDHAAELLLSEAQTGRGSRRAARRLPLKKSTNPTIPSVCVPAHAVRSRAPAQSGTMTASSSRRTPASSCAACPARSPRRSPRQSLRCLGALSGAHRARSALALTHPRACSAVPEKRERVIAVRPTYASKCVSVRLLACAPSDAACSASFGARPHRPFMAPQVAPAAPTSSLLHQARACRLSRCPLLGRVLSERAHALRGAGGRRARRRRAGRGGRRRGQRGGRRHPGHGHLNRRRLAAVRATSGPMALPLLSWR